MNSRSIKAIAEIQSYIEYAEKDTALYFEVNFDNRADAIDFIDFHIIDRINGLMQKTSEEKFCAIRQRAEQLKCRLEKIDSCLFKQLRENIRAGIYTPASFVELIAKHIKCSYDKIASQENIGYDNLDTFINGILFHQSIPEPTAISTTEMVFYQKTPARIILELATLAQLQNEDVFFDIGSGLGQAVILINLISGAMAKGIEYEPAYCKYAIECFQQLNLPGIEFVNADAREADYSKGTVFFLYTPFEGNMLQEMLEVLRRQSLKRLIRIFSYGPCSPHINRQNWLHCTNGNADNINKLYEFRSLDF